jgi:ABC-type methionine transport system ATPase subunit
LCRASAMVKESYGKISVRRLTLRLDNEATVLREVSLEVEEGSITSVVGPSGSGKSSLLRCLNRLWEPPAGTVFFDGQDVTTMDVLALRRRVGMLFQSANLFEGTVANNVGYGPSLEGRSLTARRIAELLQMAGLEPRFAAETAAKLSGGEAQRVALARALANEPEVLLLDEPTSALDPAATLHVERTIRDLQQMMDLTVVLVTHDIEQVRRMADSAALLIDGRIVESGTADHLMNSDHHLMRRFAAGDL